MLFSRAILFLFPLITLPPQLNAQINPITIPACSTAYTIVESCNLKLGPAATITSDAFSCICYDNNGNYVPTSYDNAAAACGSTLVSAYHTSGNAFLEYVQGFCTNPSYAPSSPSTVIASTTAGSGSAVSTTTTETSTTATVLPGGVGNSTSSTTASSFSSTGSVASTTTSKAGANALNTNQDGSPWSLFASLLGALLIF